jgi:hypothetical protein
MDNAGNQANGKMPRGAKPSPRNILAAAVPHQMVGATPASFLYQPNALSFWGNDVHGDCVTAEEAFAKACNSPEIFIPEQEAIDWAQSNGWLEGAYLSEVLEKMTTNGFQTDGVTYDDGQYNSVDWTNTSVLQNAISIGPVKIGVGGDQLDTAWHNGFWNAGKKNGWFATGFASEPGEDHCVSLCGYGTLSWLAQQFGVQVPNGVNGQYPSYALFTWDSIAIIDQNSMLAITHEAWVRNPTTIVMGTYQKRILDVATTFTNENDGTWLLTPSLDLAFIKTGNTPNGNVEVHIASRASNYQQRILEVATIFGNENDGTWLLTPSLDLAFIKTSNTPNGNVEVHIASKASNYQQRILDVATTFANENDGTWLLTPSLDLAFIKTSNTPNGHVEVHIASKASNYQQRILDVATTFANENDGTWLLTPSLDLAFIKTSNTPNGHVEVHIASK